jgi:hypothetical protein
MRSGLPRCQRGQFIVGGDAARIDLTDVRARSLRLQVHRRRAIAEGNIDRPRRGGVRFVMPDEGWRGDLRRKDRLILRIVDCNRGGTSVTLGENETAISKAEVDDTPRESHGHANSQECFLIARCRCAFDGSQSPIQTMSHGYHQQLSPPLPVLLAFPIFWFRGNRWCKAPLSMKVSSTPGVSFRMIRDSSIWLFMAYIPRSTASSIAMPNRLNCTHNPQT